MQLFRADATMFSNFFFFLPTKTWKNHRLQNKKLHRKKVKKKLFWGGEDFFFQKNHFFLGLKFEWNLGVNTVRSGTDYCWLYCVGEEGVENLEKMPTSFKDDP